MSVISGQSYYSAPGAPGGAASSVSVFTHSSVHTTQSTRSRRPGAARERLAKAKEAEERRQYGWHESISAAAAAESRVWEPKLGWVEYNTSDQEDEKNNDSFFQEETDGVPISDEKLNIPLHVFAKSKKNKRKGTHPNSFPRSENPDNIISPEPVDFSFPTEWQKERTDMVFSTSNDTSMDAAAADIQAHKSGTKNKPKAKKSRSPSRIIDSIPASLDGKRQQDESCWPKPRHKGAMRSPERHKIRQVVAAKSPAPREQASNRSRREQRHSPNRRPFVVPPEIRRVATSESPVRQRQKSPSHQQQQQQRMASPTPTRPEEPAVFYEQRTQSLSPFRGDYNAMASPLPPSAPPRPTDNDRLPSSRGQLSTSTVNHSANHSPESPKQFNRMSDSPARSTRSKGWVETMRDATASLAEDGYKWDPRNGFSNLDTSSVSDMITVGSAKNNPNTNASTNNNNATPATGKNLQQKANHPLQNRNIHQKSPARGPDIAERRKDDPPGRTILVTEEAGNGSPLSEQQDDVPSPVATTTLPNLETAEASAKAERSFAKTSNVSEDYQSIMQEPIEVTPDGVLSSAPKVSDFGIAALNFEEKEDFILGPVLVTPNIFVKKEKVGDEDVGWFPPAQRQATRNQEVETSTTRDSAKNDYLSKSKGASVSSRSRSSNSKRYSGPVDVDEVDIESSDDDDESETAFPEAKFENDSFLQGSIISSAKMRKKGQSETRATITPTLKSSPIETSEKPIFWSAHARRLAKTVTSKSTEHSWAGRSGENPSDESGTKLTEEAAENPNDESGKTLAEEAGEKTIKTAEANVFQDAMDDGIRAAPDNTKRISAAPEKRNDGSPEGKPTCSPNPYPQEVSTDDRSEMSSTSSATAGWKSFLNKKVQAERAVAANQKQYVFREETKGEKDSKDIKKTVSFASEISDSLLAESSIFDFSTCDEPNSPGRGRSEHLPGGAYIGRESQDRNKLSSSRGQSRSFEKTSHRHHVRPYGSMDSEDKIPFRKNRSFGTEVSPIMERDDESESAIGTSSQGPEQSSFFQRLAECAAPALPLKQRSCLIDQGHDSAKKDTVAYRAAEKVEEMMEVLRTRRCNVPGRDSPSTQQDSSTTSAFREKLSSRMGVSSSSSSKSDSAAITPERDPEDSQAFEDLAKARVQAMLDTLYYDEA